ncbi:MAG: hypothetical protein IJP32_10335 [Clostridia bacterium]|nr:hypothetical protein [Clostridia bacterium]
MAPEQVTSPPEFWYDDHIQHYAQMFLNTVKPALRIETEITAYDPELLLLMRACHEDLRVAGVEDPFDNHDLLVQAWILYCKAYFGSGDERFERSYQMLRDSFALSHSGYGGE